MKNGVAITNNSTATVRVAGLGIGVGRTGHIALQDWFAWIDRSEVNRRMAETVLAAKFDHDWADMEEDAAPPAAPEPEPEERDEPEEEEPAQADEDTVDTRRENILAAMRSLDRDDPSLWTRSGKPKATAVQEAVGFQVSAGEREALWAEAQQS